MQEVLLRTAGWSVHYYKQRVRAIQASAHYPLRSCRCPSCSCISHQRSASTLFPTSPAFCSVPAGGRDKTRLKARSLSFKHRLHIHSAPSFVMPAIRGSDSKSKTRRRKRDLDQVYEDLRSPKHLAQYKETKAVEDLPALGEFYCTECAKWFEAEHNLIQHRRGKPHKRRLRQLQEQPYTQKDAEAAIGLTTDNGRPEPMAVDQPAQEAEEAEPAITAKNEDDHEEYDAFFKAY